MPVLAFIVLVIASLAPLCAADGAAGGQAPADQAGSGQRLAYLYGHGPLAEHLQRFAADHGLEIEDVIAGLRDAVSGAPSRVSGDEQAQLLQLLEQKRLQRAQAAAAGNMKKGQEYIAQVKQREGVETTDSGICYEVLVAGDGPQPQPGDSVKCHYRGTFIDGKEFDSSYANGGPATFPLAQVIAGWQEGIPMMKVGGKWRFHVPSDLAYGPRGKPPKIAPNQTLVFEVELLDILPAPTAAQR